MKKNKNKLKIIQVPILNDTYSVNVYIGDRFLANTEISKYLGTEYKEWIKENNRGKSIYFENIHPCIWIDGNLDYMTGIGTLSHESVHAVSSIMEYLAMDCRDLSGNEFLAHSVGAIVRKTLQNFKFNTK